MKILYIAPTKILAKEAFDYAKNVAEKQGINVSLLRGREGETQGRAANCFRMSKVYEVAKRGFSPGLIICPSCSYRKDKTCPYWKQFDAMSQPGLFITTHSQSKYIEQYKMDLLIVDENPTKVFIEKERAGLGAILKFKAGIGPEGKKIFEKIQIAIEELLEELQEISQNTANYDTHGRLYATKAPEGGHWDEKESLWQLSGIKTDELVSLSKDLSFYDQWACEKKGQHQMRLYEMNVDLNALNWLWMALGKKGGTAYILVNSKNRKNPFKFVSIKLNLPNHTGRVIILDGTGNKAEYDNLFQRDFKLIPANVGLNDCGTVFLQQALGKVKSIKLDDETIENLLKKAIDHLKLNDKKVLVATHMNIEDNVLRISKQLLPDRHLETTHFWASRGVNKYQDFDAVIAFGTPTVNKVLVLDEGMILFQDSNEREEWFAQMGTDDLIQTIHRIRPINGNKTIIVMGREWPKEIGIPGIHIDLRRGEQTQIKEACNRIKMFLNEYRFITKEIAWGLGIGCKREMDRMESIRDQIQQMITQGDDENFVPCLIKTILLDKEQTFKPHSLIIFGRPSYWRTLISMLKQDFPHLPELNTRQGRYGGKASRGLGYLKSVREYYQMVSKDAPNKEATIFHEEMWEGEETISSCKLIPFRRKTLSDKRMPQIRQVAACPGFIYLDYNNSFGQNFHLGFKSKNVGIPSMEMF